MANKIQTLSEHLCWIWEFMIDDNVFWEKYINIKLSKNLEVLKYFSGLVWILHDLWKSSTFFQINRLWKNSEKDITYKEWHNWWYLFLKDIFINFLKEKWLYNNISPELIETLSYVWAVTILNHHFDLDNNSRLWELEYGKFFNYKTAIKETRMWQMLLSEYITKLFDEWIINLENIKDVYNWIYNISDNNYIRELSNFIANKYNFSIDIFKFNQVYEFTGFSFWKKKEDESMSFINKYIINRDLSFNLINFIFLPKLLNADKKISIWINNFLDIKYDKNTDNDRINNFYNKNFTSTEWLNWLRWRFFNKMNLLSKENINKKIHFIEAPAWIWKFLSLTNYASNLLSENLNKIVYIAPFVSILDQNSGVIKEQLLWKEDDINDENFSKINYLTQKRYILDEKEWFNIDSIDHSVYLDKFMLKSLNSKFVFTTFVNIFNSLFSFKNIDYIQTFNLLNNSILIIDEIQDFSKEHIFFLNYFLNNIIPNHNIKVIVSSATLPSYLHKNITNKDDILIYNYYNDNEFLYSENQKYFNRVNFEFLVKDNSVKTIERLSQFEYNIWDDELYQNIINRFKNNKKILFINNTIKSSRELWKNVLDKLWIDIYNEWNIVNWTDWNKYKFYFLNNRDKNKYEKEKIIDEIKNIDNNEYIILLFSTQLIKAGVDIDMDICFSDFFNFYDITQIAWRVNRNNKRENDNKMYIYVLEDDEWKRDFEKIQWKNDNNSTNFTAKYIAKYWLVTMFNEQDLYTNILPKYDKAFADELNFTDYDILLKDLNFDEIIKKSKLIQNELSYSYIKPLDNILFLWEEDRYILSDFLNKMIANVGNVEEYYKFNEEIKIWDKSYNIYNFISSVSSKKEYDIINKYKWLEDFVF